MKKIILLVLLCFSTLAVKTQDFKEVKTAQDVVDNYLLAVGGADALKEVKSIQMKGKMASAEMNGENGGIEIYYSDKYVYMNISTAMFSMKQAIDFDKKKGWTLFGEMFKEMNEEELQKSQKSIEGTLWGNFLNPKASGITYLMLENEHVDGKDAYVIDLVKDGANFLTVFFDTKTFLKIKDAGSTTMTEYADFKETGDLKIVMPYTIKNKAGDVVLTEIKFNSKFNKKLLKKPEVKDSEDKKEDK